MPSSTVENYLKRIYLEQQAISDGLVPMGKLAGVMGVVPGTATTMIKALADSGLVAYEPRGGARLTHAGEQLALHVLRRHRLVESFLVTILGLDWSEVHEEAEELEHAISDKVLERMDALLERPSHDPHGDPIPTARGVVSQRLHKSLADCELGIKVRIARVVDQNPQFLQFASQHALTPGTVMTVQSRDTLADAVTVRGEDGRQTILGLTAAEKLLVEDRGMPPDF